MAEKSISLSNFKHFLGKINEKIASVEAKTATITVGSVTEGDNAAVTNSGTTGSAVFDFVLPRGEKGEKGDQGVVGPQGAAGANGLDGRDGKDGKSAYALAVENGFTGTEAEWLESLKGKDGNVEQNAAFINLRDAVLDNNNKVRFYSRSEVDSKIADAAAGKEVDLTGYATTTALATKADKSSVYTKDEMDTKLSGVVGQKGDKGDKGDAGPAGRDGAQGPQGIQGEPGAKGADGKDGKAATIAVGSVTEGAQVQVINSGTANAAVFDFVLPKAQKGVNGKSAYEIAVTNGFTGTESEWLNSLKGEKGSDATVDLTGYAKTTDIPDVSNLATKDEVKTAVTEAAPDLSSYAKKTDIPDVSGLAKKSDIPTLTALGGLTKEEIQVMIDTAIKNAKSSTDNTSGEKADDGKKDTPTDDKKDDSKTDKPTTPANDDDKWEWTHLMIVPPQQNLIKSLTEVLGEEVTDDMLTGPDENGENVIEFRLLDGLRENPPVEGPTLADNNTYKRNYWIKQEKGIRVPIDGINTEEDEKIFGKAIPEGLIHCGFIYLEGDGGIRFQTHTIANTVLYMVRKAKNPADIAKYTPFEE